MPRVALPLLIALAACRPSFDSLEEACLDRTPGESAFANPADPAIGVVHQVNCYRRYAGLSKVRVSDRLSDAAAAHARYTDLNGFEATDGGLFENPALEGFTGVDPLERGEEFGYDWGYGGQGYWESTAELAELSPDDYVTSFMHEPYARQAVLQPSLVAVGYGTEGSWSVSDWHYDWPASESASRPILWPVPGASDVPISAPYLDDDGVTRIHGYVTTATFGGGRGELGDTNPFGIVVRDFALTGPDGEVPSFTLRPESALGAYPYSVGIVPEGPLTAHTTYRAMLDVSWDGRAQRIEWDFTTSEEAIE